MNELKTMKIVFGILLAVSVLAMVGAPALALAQTDPPTDQGLPPDAKVPGTGAELLTRIGLIGNWVFAIFLAMSLIYIVLGAFQFVTGGGDPEQVSAARQKLIYAAVGIAIALLAAGFDDVLRNILVG
tara:strand:- start:4 stop:387 length:384 start_codon:yes stop_codon:yes gene_type:complete